MSHHRIFVWQWGIVLGVVPVSAARGGPVTFAFTGVVTDVTDPTSFLAGVVDVDDALSGVYTFETTTPAGGNSTSTWGQYFGAIQSFTARIGGLDLPLRPGSHEVIYVFNNHPTLDSMGHLVPIDGYRVWNESDYGSDILLLQIDLVDPTTTVFEHRALPDVPPDLARFLEEMRNFSLYWLSAPQGRTQLAEGRITSLTLVPEPATLFLLGFGVLALARGARFRVHTGA